MPLHLCRMPPRKLKQVAKGFKGLKEVLFRGSESSKSRKEQLWRSANPEVPDEQPIVFQRDEVSYTCV